jgi:hypothetical protein
MRQLSSSQALQRTFQTNKKGDLLLVLYDAAGAFLIETAPL